MSTRILFIADSRGRLLQAEISRFFDTRQYCFIWRNGLKLEDSANFARTTILSFKPTMVYILTGLCSITCITSRDPWTAGLRTRSVGGTVSRYLRALDCAHQEIYSMSSIIGSPIMIVIPTLTGMNFTTYNSYPSDLVSPLQRILNASIAEINRYVVAMNRATRVKTPFLAASVHPRCRHRYRNSFVKLLDGVHPSQDLCAVWAYKLYVNAMKNLDYYPTFYLINHMY